MGITIDTDHPTTNAAVGVWGADGQKAILQEECSELISAVARFNRGRTDEMPVAEEIADVIVSMMSVIPALGVEEEVKKFIGCKLTRLRGRIIEFNEGQREI